MKPEVIWHSGKLRARQTAEPFLRLCNPLAEFAAIRGLQPTDPPNSISDLVAGETREILLVGHMPNLPRVLTLLVTGARLTAAVVSLCTARSRSKRQGSGGLSAGGCECVRL